MHHVESLLDEATSLPEAVGDDKPDHACAPRVVARAALQPSESAFSPI